MPQLQLATCSYPEFQDTFGLPVKISLYGVRYKLKYKIPPASNMWELTPRADYLKAPDDVFNARYYNQLDNMGVDLLRERFAALAKEHDATTLVFLCFERLGKDRTGKPVSVGTYCHRRMFAAWWQRHTGEIVPELGSLPEDGEDLTLLG